MSAAAAQPYTKGGTPSYDPRAPNGGGERVYEHIDDLKVKAAQGYNPQSSINELLKTAEVGLDQAQTLNNFRRPDLAFVEFLRASEIVLNIIPHHKEYTHFTVDQPERANKLVLLQKRISAQNEQFAAIKQIVVHQNSRYGIKPHVGQNGHIRTDSAPAAQMTNAGHPANGAPVQKARPTPSPKPESMHGRAIAPGPTNGNTPAGGMDLGARFAQLRTDPTQRPDSRSSISSVQSSSPVSMPSAADFARGPSFDNLTRTNSLQSRPYGPRGMPSGAGQQLPPMAIPNLPQAPAAAYSPARNMETTGNIAPPRHTARSLASSTTRRSSMAPNSSASTHAPNGKAQSGEYFPSSAPNGRPPAQPPRRTSIIAPIETEILPGKLYDYIKRYHVLLIDFRSREEYDNGHLYTRNVMCVDPLSIRQGMSAEELQDSLVLSPETEQDMFFQRDQFDFIVYYDTDTASESQLERPIGQRQIDMQYLREALFDFNQEKPLRQPPVLLKGGIDAWTDMIGPQALISSDTLSKVKKGQGIKRRPIATSTVNGDRELRVPKRRLRDYNPLDAEEEHFWREKARTESVVLLNPPELSEDGVQDTIAEGDEDAEPSTAIQEFLERFPDAGNLDKQAFANQKPTRAPPQVPAKVPMYPPAPSPSQHPQVPTRPVPAAPRMSYQGVSDRAVSTTQPASRNASGQLMPYVPPRLLATNIRLPRTGLVNFRNTCYMNSTIQALSATTPLSIFLMDNGYESHLQKDNWKSTREVGHITAHYANLIRNLWGGDVEVVKPTTFRNVIRRLARQFDNDEQQDAKEFYDVLIDMLHEDMNTNWSRTPLRALTEQEEAKRERMPKTIVAKTEWGRSTHRDLSFIYNLFAGQHASKLTCLTCGFTSTTYETFNSISVEIPTDPRQWANGRNCTLDDCLRSYCSEEMLTKDEKWKCPHCKMEREAKKRITLTRAPQFLVVHFKRFASSHGQRSQKIRTPVDFPLDNFNLEPYMLPQPTVAEAQQITDLYGPDALKTDTSMTPPYTYDAYGVVRHLGATMQGGHYITAAKDQGRKCWHMFDDSRVGDFLPEQLRFEQRLQSEQAYIVFFQRQGQGMGGGGGGGGGGAYGKM